MLIVEVRKPLATMVKGKCGAEICCGGRCGWTLNHVLRLGPVLLRLDTITGTAAVCVPHACPVLHGILRLLLFLPFALQHWRELESCPGLLLARHTES